VPQPIKVTGETETTIQAKRVPMWLKRAAAKRAAALGLDFRSYLIDLIRRDTGARPPKKST